MKKIALFLVMAIAAIACSPAETPVTPEVKVLSNPESLMLSAAGDEVYVNFEANVNWTASLKDASAADWCMIAPREGKAGQGAVRVTVMENPTDVDRTLVLVITAQSDVAEVEITQMQKDALVAGKTAYEVGAEGGEVKVKIAHNVDFNVVSDSDWLTKADTKVLTESEVVFNAAANPTLEERVAKVTFTSGTLRQVVTVTQAPFVPTFEFSVAEVWIDYAGGTGEVEITSDYDFELTIPESCTWLTVERNGDTFTFTAQETPELTYRYVEIKITGYSSKTNKFYVFQNGRSVVEWEKDLVDDYSMTLAGGPVRMAMTGEYLCVANNGTLAVFKKADGSHVTNIPLPEGVMSVTNDDAGHIVFAGDMLYSSEVKDKIGEGGEVVKDESGNPVQETVWSVAPVKIYYMPSIDADPVELAELEYNHDVWTNSHVGNMRVKGDVTQDALVTMTVYGGNCWYGFEVKNGVVGTPAFGQLLNMDKGFGYGHAVFCPLGTTVADGIAAVGYATPWNLYISDDAEGKNFVATLPQKELINPIDTHWNGNDDPNSIYNLKVGNKEYLAVGIGTHFNYTQARVNVYDITDRYAATLVGKLNLPNSSTSWKGDTGAWSDVIAEVSGNDILVYYVSGNNHRVLCFKIIG